MKMMTQIKAGLKISLGGGFYINIGKLNGHYGIGIGYQY